MTRSNDLCLVTKTLLQEAHIPDMYTCYSIRHAAITKLYGICSDPLKVNVFTGHSERANTSSKFYLHEIDNWLGFALASAKDNPNPITARISEDGNKMNAFSLSHSEDEEPSSNGESESSPDPERTLTDTRPRSSSPGHKSGKSKQKRRKQHDRIHASLVSTTGNQ
jgi:hypothetical protein